MSNERVLCNCQPTRQESDRRHPPPPQSDGCGSALIENLEVKRVNGSLQTINVPFQHFQRLISTIVVAPSYLINTC